jgi:hypothetical protein
MDESQKVKETAENLRAIAKAITPMLPASHGFLLMTFEVGAPGRLNYLSNGERGDIVKMLREFIGKFERDSAGE